MGIMSFLHSLRSSSPKAVQARLDALTHRIHALDDAGAEQAFSRICATETLFRLDRTPLSPDEIIMLTQLPRRTRTFFEEYRGVETNSMRIARQEIGSYKRDAAWWRIGSDIEHADVVVRESDGLVAIIEDDGASTLNLEDNHPSIWHYLVFVAECSRPE
jgi:hypothetical protein